MSAETIFALSTPPGRSGVAVVRVSGPQAWEGLESLRGKSNTQPLEENKSIPHPKVELCKINHPVSRETIDEALVLIFKSPASYTGEDVVEYQIHGGRAVVDSLLDVLSVLPDHRMAEPGEFTRRAFENGKMDLTKAEAVTDLIDAETQAQRSQALAQMGGALSTLYESWAETLTKTLAHLEADIEFPDEDLPGGITPEIATNVKDLRSEIDTHLDDNRRGERLRDGIHVAVIGAPNAGKSSLVNALAQRDVAIVSELAGTTRDIIEVHLDLDGYPVVLADTAGLRPDQIGEEGQDSIESEGIRRALKHAEEADLKLLLFDGTQAQPDPHTLSLIDENAIFVINKSDQDLVLKDIPGGVKVSATQGSGLEDLINVLIEKCRTLIGRNETPSLTRRRHRTALEESQAALTRSLEADLPELMAEDLRLAVRALGRITGKVDVEDLLDVIFKDFCIGK